MASPNASRVSAVILAAGANTRLAGIVPSYMKPLILVNGRPLIQHAVEHAEQDWGVSQVIVVVSPVNAHMLTQILTPSRFDWVLQPEPLGVVDAIARALTVVRWPRTLIMCADNTFDRNQPVAIGKALDRNTNVIVTRDMPIEAARRFTRISENSGRVLDACSSEDSRRCWVGPLLLSTPGLKRVLDDDLHITIASLITLASGEVYETLPMECADLGVPEAL